MTERPDIPGLELGSPLGRVGRARRFELAADRELWWLDEEETRVWQRLRELGAHGIGGFLRGGETDQGLWLERVVGGATLAQHLDAAVAPALDQLGPLRALLRALVFVEEEALFPGPIRPSRVLLHELGVIFLAEDLVRSLLGAGEPSASLASSRASPRWTPPEQAEGEPWNNAANRYVLGLALYRALAGEDPFGGRGLRLSLEARADRPPPPFRSEIARSLPPGLQSLVLRCLDPDPRQRPGSAQEIASALSQILDGHAPLSRRASRLAEPDPGPVAEERTPASPRPATHAHARVDGSARRATSFSALAVFAAGAVAMLVAYLLSSGKDAPARRERLERSPLSVATMRTEDCATCHPRQAGEWRRSVMAHSVKSPLFQALEMLIEEQVGRDFDCPAGAGALRRADPTTACRERNSGQLVTGSGGEHWCVNCHSPADNLGSTVPAWDARGRGGNPTLADALSPRALEGVSCVLCHQAHPPRESNRATLGNAFWTSAATGIRYSARPEDARGVFGISNSGYALSPQVLLSGVELPGALHGRLEDDTRAHLRSSEFCGSCHDVRLFGTDVVGIRERGEHFKRLRNAYSEWRAWADAESRAGRTPASCQDCHMTQFPGICAPGKGSAEASAPLQQACPPGTHFVEKPPGSYVTGMVATGVGEPRPLSLHYFSGVDLPLDPSFDSRLAKGDWTDTFGIPQALSRRAQLLLASSVRLTLEPASVRGTRLTLPVTLENVGAGHRVPAGFSQERELWLHLVVSDAEGRVLYEVGRVDRADEDLHDKVFLRVNTDDRFLDGQGRPQGLFGADVADGPDVPRWQPNPRLGGTRFRGSGLVNFQNGFLRCVVCIGRVEADGSCSALPGQDRSRADRFADGNYDIDSGECSSNLRGEDALFETYFPVGALDASRGVIKAPDAIIDRRSLAPGAPVTYTYELALRGRPHRVEARLLFRAFPPFLLKAFVDYERKKRPSRPLMSEQVLERLEIHELARSEVLLP
ncbi:MAG: hypothetical protein R3B13_38305 [Polyangiaceae bacterium]